MCIEQTSYERLEVLTPATTDNVAGAENFSLWMELNFWPPMELFTPRRVDLNARKCGGIENADENRPVKYFVRKCVPAIGIPGNMTGGACFVPIGPPNRGLRKGGVPEVRSLHGRFL
jgi:hypothetical protein